MINSLNYIFKSLELKGFEGRSRESLKFIIEIAWHGTPPRSLSDLKIEAKICPGEARSGSLLN
jgi:hypothetical protein